MKKWIVWLLVILILGLVSIYIFIPAKIVISRIITSEVTMPGEFRMVSREEKWEKWWRNSEGKPHVKGEPFTYNRSVFRITSNRDNITGIEIEQDGMKLQSVLHLISFKSDSTGAIWECEMHAGNSPINRLSTYNKAAELSKNMKAVLQNLKNYVSDPQNVYEISIHRSSTRDTTLLSARFISPTYPTTAEIYGYLDIVEKSIQKQKGIVSNFPLLNVRKLDSGGFETQVAIPTNRLLENDGKIFYRRMFPGNFLTAEIKGGPYTLMKAEDQLENFQKDNKKTVMAKPFQQLITNRMKEKDTLRWITRIYLPVMQ
jgi:hypothetical protein